MMQMLARGGFKCAGEYPAFEDARAKRGEITHDFLSQFDVVKVLDPLLCEFPPGFNYVFLWMRRDKTEQAKSILKFLCAIGLPNIDTSVHAVRVMRKSLVKDTPVAIRYLQSLGPVTVIDFEELVSSPFRAIRKLPFGISMASERAKEMASVVIPRPTHCLKEMLEFKQLANT